MPHHDPRDTSGHYRPGLRHSQPLPPRRQRRTPQRRRAALTATAVLTVTVVGGSLAAIALRDPADGTAGRTTDRATLLSAVADTYVIRQQPTASNGERSRLTASEWPTWNTESYLAFDVPAGQRVRSARIQITLRDEGRRPPRIDLRSLPSSWDERGTSWENRPVPGAVVATAGTQDRRVTFDVGAVISGPGRYAFAITNPGDGSGAALYSRESGRRGPRLILNRPTTAPAPRPTPTSSPEDSPTARPEPRPTPTVTPTPTPTPTPSPDSGDKPAKPLCGVSLNFNQGESYEQALSRMDLEYGGLETVRLFYRGVPPAWPGNPDTGNRPPIISFKLAPRDVLAGKHDAAMSHWFATAPHDRDVYWIYYHEPEDNVANGEFTAADYRAAWRRLRQLADRANNDRLHATLVLMGWSLTDQSRRNWRDYYPGRDVIQVLGWDVYNLSDKKAIYDSPAVMYDRAVEVSRKEDLPFGVAETGSYVVKGDDGTRRAAWIRATNKYLHKNKALWVAYFDLNWPSGDFRLLDPPSKKAWRDFC